MPEINEIKSRIEPIAKAYGIKRVFLFGSYAKGKATPTSDIDILIEKGAPLSLLGLSGFRNDLQDEFGLSVDLVTTAGISDDFKELIDGTEVLVYEN